MIIIHVVEVILLFLSVKFIIKVWKFWLWWRETSKEPLTQKDREIAGFISSMKVNG